MFENYTERIFIINGYTRDYIALQDGRLMDFEFFLNEYLKEHLSYQRVFFLDTEGLYFLDQESMDLLMQKNTNRASKTISNLLPRKGPAGGFTTRKRVKKPLETPTKLRYHNIKTIESLFHLLTDSFKEEIPTAMVIYDDRFINPYDGYYNRFLGFFKTILQRLPVENRNIVILACVHQDFERLTRNQGWDFFGTNRDHRSLETYTYIGGPEKDEIESLIQWYRLTKKKRIHWSSLDKLVQSLTREVKEEELSLKDLASLITKSIAIDSSLLQREESIASLENNNPMEELNRLIGLKDLKRTIKEIVDGGIGLKKEKVSSFLPTRFTGYTHQEGTREMMHLALMGSPGTGKTTAAKLIGRILQDAGILEIGHTVKVTRNDLVAGYSGQTAMKTEAVLNRAMGGVLFIDEAYSLVQDDRDTFGKEALDKLVEAMTDRAGEFLVIMAGYEREMEELLKQNPGLPGRIKKIKIPDYSPEELKDILPIVSQELECNLHPLLQERALFFTTHLLRNRKAHGGEHFRNAGTLRELLVAARRRARSRNDSTITIDDFHEEIQHYFQEETILTPEEELMNLVGLEDIKTFIKDIKLQIQYDLERKKRVQVDHFLFLGNPGTGKTTVARYMANLYHELNLLKTNKFIERTATDLIGTVVGETEKKTKKALEEALDGVLFIDEAHQLYSPREGLGYGKEVIKVLVPFLENQKGRLCVILAGYPAEMQAMLKGDPGLISRFGERIHFKDFHQEELATIFLQLAEKDNFSLEEGSMEILTTLMRLLKEKEGREFSNGRSVRNFLNRVKSIVAHRYYEEKEREGSSRISFIKRVDLREALKQLEKEDSSWRIP